MIKHPLLSGAIATLLLSAALCTSAQNYSMDWSAYIADKACAMKDTELVEGAIMVHEGTQDYIYLTGKTRSTSSAKTVCDSHLGNGDCFLAKYTNKGKAKWIKYFGGPGDDTLSTLDDNYDWAYCLAADKAPNGSPRIYVGGTTLKNKSEYPCLTSACGSAPYQSKATDDWDGFVAKFDGNGTMLNWTFLGGADTMRSDTDEVLAMDIHNHQVFVAGYMEGSQQTLLQSGKVSGIYDTTYNGGGDAFIAVLDTCLSNLDFFSYVNANSDLNDHEHDPVGQDRIHSIKVSATGNIYVNGTSPSGNGIVNDTITHAHGKLDAFIQKWIPDTLSGYKPEWGRYFGGSEIERGRQIVLDANENVFFAGITKSDSTTFHAVNTSIQNTSDGEFDSFVGEMDKDGIVKWLTYYGGVDNDLVNGICLVTGTGLNGTVIGCSGLTKSYDFYATHNYASPVANNLNGDTASVKPLITPKNDAFLLMLQYDDVSDTIATLKTQFGSFVGGSSAETYGPTVPFTGYGPFMVQGSDGALYFTCATASNDVGKINHGNATKVMGKLKGATDVVLTRFKKAVAGKETQSLTDAANADNTAGYTCYPQPFSDILTVESEAGFAGSEVVSVYNMEGALMESFVAGSIPGNILQLDFPMLKSGCYLMRVVGKAQSHVFKIVKM